MKEDRLKLSSIFALIKTLFYLGFNLTFLISTSAETVYGPEFEFRGEGRGRIEAVCISLIPLFLGQKALFDGEDGELEFSLQDFEWLGISVFSGAIAASGCGDVISRYHAYKMGNRLRELCLNQDCTVEKVTHHSSHVSNGKTAYRVKFPDGWHFQVSADVTAVEIQSKPLSVAEFSQRRDRLQKLVFDLAEDMKLRAPEQDWLSGGHISIGYQGTFDDNPMLFRNFIVDQINHAELSQGVHLRDNFNAAPVVKNERRLEKLRSILARFDAGEFATTEEFAKELHRKLTKGGRSLDLSTFKNDSFSQKERRVEVRAHRAQSSADEFIDLLNLYEGRLNYLRSIDGPLTLDPPLEQLSVPEQLRRYKTYVEESGLNFERYRGHLRLEYQELPRNTGEEWMRPFKECLSRQL